MKRFALCLGLFGLLALVVLSGCPKPQPASEEGGGAPAAVGKKAASPGPGANAPAAGGTSYHIGMSQSNLGEPWRVQMNADIDQAAKAHPELTVDFKDAQNKSEQQQAQVREFISQGVDLIIISPNEGAPLTKPVAEAMDARIPVIVLDRKVQGDKYTCYISGDNVLIGRKAGEYMVRLLGGKGKVVELKGKESSSPAGERHRGFMEGIKGSKIDIVFSVDCDWKEPNAQKEMNSALSRFPEIDAVYGHNDPSAHGAYMAAKQEGKGREKTIKFIGIDALPHEGVKYVADGILSATLLYPTLGEEAIDCALKILHGEKVEKNIILGTRLFTPQNVKQGGEAIPAPKK